MNIRNPEQTSKFSDCSIKLRRIKEGKRRRIEQLIRNALREKEEKSEVRKQLIIE